MGVTTTGGSGINPIMIRKMRSKVCAACVRSRICPLDTKSISSVYEQDANPEIPVRVTIRDSRCHLGVANL